MCGIKGKIGRDTIFPACRIDGRSYLLRTLATVLASSTALAAFALPAVASSAQFTLIEGFASSVDTVAYQQPVTFTGELAEGSAKTPVPDEPVQIEIQPPGQSGFVTVATGTTGSAGQFSVTTTLPSGGSVRAAFAGDTDLAPSVSNRLPTPWRAPALTR
jgi:hypothetical protein